MRRSELPLGDERHDEADKAQRLGKGGRQNEDGKGATLNLGLASHSARSAKRREADSEACTDNTETVTDNSHDSSFDVRPQARSSKLSARALG